MTATTNDTIQITVKVSAKTVTRIEGLRDFLSEETAIQATRADVVRHALGLGIRALERRRARDGGSDEELELDVDVDVVPLAAGHVRAILEEVDGSTRTHDVAAPAPNVLDIDGRYYRRVAGTNDEPHFVAGSRSTG